MLPRLPALLLIAVPLLGSTGVCAETRSVPSDDYPTVQAAVDAAVDGDVVEIAPGTYRENVRIRGKDLTLQSLGDVVGTVIEGVLELDDKGTPDPADDEMVPVSVVEVRAMSSLPGSEPTNVVLIGLTVRGGDSGVNVRPNAHVEVLDSHIVGNSDGIELEGRNETDKAFARATVRRCEIWDNGDDGVDVDQRAELWIEDSIVRDNFQDGIEIRLQDNQFLPGESIRNVILNNHLVDNGQDGLQLIDYYQLTPRSFRVERNVIAGNDASGLGMMCNEITNESFEACAIAERVELVHNTFSGNDHGLTGGANLIGVSNVFVGHTNVAVKNVVAPSLLTRSLFHGNGVDQEGTTLDDAIFADPLLETDLAPGAGSPAVDAGIAQLSVSGEPILDLGPCDYRGDAPDLGAFERDTGPPLQEVTGMLLAPASEAMIQKGSKLKAASKRLDLGSKNDDVIAGLRFEAIGIPPGAEIAAARLELMSAKKGTKPAALMIQGEASADAAPLGGAGGLAARAKTAAFASWNVPLWPAAGLSDQTPELAPVIQEIVDEPGWDEGNAVTVLFTGTGKRSVDVLGSAPLLNVDFHYMVPMCPSDL
jgi:hypothetical protein